MAQTFVFWGDAADAIQTTYLAYSILGAGVGVFFFFSSLPTGLLSLIPPAFVSFSPLVETSNRCHSSSCCNSLFLSF